jgi:CTP synthase
VARTRFIFITGGVVSSLGKGLAAAALGATLQARGYRVRLRKLDPYLNVDPGTMSPMQHGEVYVTDDGAETDLDLGHYERFTGVAARKGDNVTTGQIYQALLDRERRGDYLGATVQVIPHVTDLIKEFITAYSGDEEFMLCEIGGTVGDIESLPFLEAIRQLRGELGPTRTMFVHVTLLPHVRTAGELKTKPTQHSVKELLSVGIQPDMLLCRSDIPIPEAERRKIALFCNVRPERVVSALDARTIYEVPIAYHNEGLDDQVLDYFNMGDDTPPDLGLWQRIVSAILEPEGTVKIGLIGKYIVLPDAYKSINEALAHGGIANKVNVDIQWVASEELTPDNVRERLAHMDGILVGPGFGERGTEGKVCAVRYARENNVPFLGICLGMQMAVVEGARHTAGISGAGSSEFGRPIEPVIGLMTEWTKGNRLERRSDGDDMGGTMRLGAYEAVLSPDSRILEVYGRQSISERHRHRYEVNPAYRERLEAGGLQFTGMSPDGVLPEIVERPDHPWFIGVQYHPELKSKPFDPHPLFQSFVAAAVKQSRLV